jgi:predicted AlkP superfamily phosphohydrolase/phosphomutase
MKSNKVFILGLDGATFTIIMPLIKRGKLPVLARLIREGAHGVLNSTVLTNSAPAWTSFATGMNPGKHSILGFTKMVPDSYQLKLLKGTDNKAKTLWEISGEFGKSSIVVNIPMTYPPKKINGILISGLDTPGLSAEFTHPPEFKNELLRVVPDYRINLHLGGYLHNNKRRRKAIGVMLSSIRARERAVHHLMKSYPWDLFAVRFNSPDNVQHQFWRFMDERHPDYDPRSPEPLKTAIYTIYEELDRVIGSIERILPEDCTMIIMSDHGAGPRTNKTIRLNEWLQSLGYLTSEATHRKHKSYVYIAMEKILSTLLKRVPPDLKQWLMKCSPSAISKTWTYFRFPDLGWSETKAFVGETEGIRINLKGRYPNGIVEPDEYEVLRDQIIDAARKLRDPNTGERLFNHVARREDTFSGPYIHEFPDIITIPTKDQYNISTRLSHRKGATSLTYGFISREEHWRKVSGSHRKEGVLIIHGGVVMRGAKIQDADITDVFPTALYLQGLPVPSNVDGKVLADAFSEEYVRQNPVRFLEATQETSAREGRPDDYTADEEATLVDHLRGLGYME